MHTSIPKLLLAVAAFTNLAIADARPDEPANPDDPWIFNDDGTVTANDDVKPVAQGLEIKPYSDGGCTAEIPDHQLFDITAKFPDSTAWSNVEFKNVSTNSKGGFDVWWNIPTPEPQCQTMIMKAYSNNAQYGSIDGAAPYGDIVLQSEAGGCIYMNVPAKAYLFGATCCGNDCDMYSMQKVGAKAPSPKPAKRSGGSIAARANAAVSKRKDSAPECHATLSDGVLKRGNANVGRQQQVSATNTCSSNICNFSKSNGVSFGSSLTTSRETSLSVGEEFSVSLAAGMDFLFLGAEVTTTMGASFTQAASDSTGTTVTNNTEASVAMLSGMQPGTKGFLTFTPDYQCWVLSMDCGQKEGPIDMDYCNPVLNDDGTPQGTHNIVYIDN